MSIKRILIGSEEICGFIGLLTGYYRTKGYEVVSIASKTKFYSYEYDMDPADFFAGWKKYSKTNAFSKFFISIAYSLLPSRFKHGLINRLKKSFIQEFDLYINIWKCFFDEEQAFAAMNEKGGKWMTLVMGDDIRNRWVFQNNFDIDDNLLPGVNKSKEHLESKMKRLRLFEKNASLIFSGPDQASLALRPYYHAHVPVDLSEITFNIPQNKKLKVVHCPSDSNAKGTSIIERVVNELIEEGEEIEFVNIRNVPHIKLMNVLSESDILLDELVFHGPGYLSFEAMASGCAVLTKYYENSPECFRPPLISVTKENVKEKLKVLIGDRDKIKQLAIEGRDYVEKNNKLEFIADYFMDCLEGKREFDYVPDYFRNHFDPETYGLSKEAVNENIESVKDCSWYKEYIKSGNRAGLNF